MLVNLSLERIAPYCDNSFYFSHNDMRDLAQYAREYNVTFFRGLDPQEMCFKAMIIALDKNARIHNGDCVF